MRRHAHTPQETLMSIGQLSTASGVGIDTIRFYERKGLLPAAARSASGYRKFGRTDQDRLGFIRRAQGFGFSLEEIAVLLRSRKQQGGVAAAKALAREKLVALEERAAELLRLKAELTRLVDRCPGAGDVADCPILGAFEPLPVRHREAS